MLSPRAFAGFVLMASAIVLGAALLSQYWGGLAPCELCLLQRWPWAAAIAISLVALIAVSRSALPWVALGLALIFVLGVAAAFYHVGVEQHWFEWSLFGVSLAGWNLLASLGMAALCADVFRRTRRKTPQARVTA